METNVISDFKIKILNFSYSSCQWKHFFKTIQIKLDTINKEHYKTLTEEEGGMERVKDMIAMGGGTL